MNPVGGVRVRDSYLRPRELLSPIFIKSESINKQFITGGFPSQFYFVIKFFEFSCTVSRFDCYRKVYDIAISHCAGLVHVELNTDGLPDVLSITVLEDFSEVVEVVVGVWVEVEAA